MNRAELAAGFGTVLRTAGVDVSTSRVMTFAEALDVVSIVQRQDVYWAGRATLLSSHLDTSVYDAAFAVFWEGFESKLAPEALDPPVTITVATDSDDEPPDSDDDDDDGESPVMAVRYSATEVLRATDFAACTAEELEQLHELMSGIGFRAHLRPSHRLVASKKSTRHPDIRRTVRRSMATGGEAIVREYRRRDDKPRRLVLLVDVSGSMENYARALLRFAHAAVVGRTRVEAFTVGTRLTRVTRELKSRDPDAAMSAAAESVRDWSGGTRIGAMLRQFNNEWGVRGLARGAVVVVLSDGWDRGDPDELAGEMERLHRVTHKLIWVNPLKHTPGYAPLARGMAAALPHVDHFVEGHAFVSLETLVEVISR